VFCLPPFWVIALLLLTGPFFNALWSMCTQKSLAKDENVKHSSMHTLLRRVLLLFMNAIIGVILLYLAFGLFVFVLVGDSRKHLDLFGFYFTTGMNGGTEIKLVHPITLEVVENIRMTERCAFARMALTTIYDKDTNEKDQTIPKEDAIALVCEEFTYQLRYTPSNTAGSRFYMVPEWSQRYRNRWEGSFPGTGPAIHDGQVLYTDNTFPMVTGNHFSLFRQPVKLSTENYISPTDCMNDEYVSNGGTDSAESINESADSNAKFCSSNKGSITAPTPPGRISQVQEYFSEDFSYVHIAPKGEAGSMFWSVVVSPLVGDIIVWDTRLNSIQSRSIKNLSLTWEIKAHNTDCISLAADTGHVYFADYNKPPFHPALWGVAVSPIGGIFFRNLTKYLIVADTHTGNIIANITVNHGDGYKASLVVPGAHNDVFVGTPEGIARIYLD
jgi:hypothetical protein